MEALLPSEIARMVLGHIRTEGCHEAAQKYLETSIHLKELLQYSKEGFHLPLKIDKMSLLDVVLDYCSINRFLMVKSKELGVQLPESAACAKLNVLFNAMSSVETLSRPDNHDIANGSTETIDLKELSLGNESNIVVVASPGDKVSANNKTPDPVVVQLQSSDCESNTEMSRFYDTSESSVSACFLEDEVRPDLLSMLTLPVTSPAYIGSPPRMAAVTGEGFDFAKTVIKVEKLTPYRYDTPPTSASEVEVPVLPHLIPLEVDGQTKENTGSVLCMSAGGEMDTSVKPSPLSTTSGKSYRLRRGRVCDHRPISKRKYTFSADKSPLKRLSALAQDTTCATPTCCEGRINEPSPVPSVSSPPQSGNTRKSPVKPHPSSWYLSEPSTSTYLPGRHGTPRSCRKIQRRGSSLSSSHEQSWKGPMISTGFQMPKSHRGPEKSAAKMRSNNSVKPGLVLPPGTPNGCRKIERQGSTSSSNNERRTPTTTLKMPKSPIGRTKSLAKLQSKTSVKPMPNSRKIQKQGSSLSSSGARHTPTTTLKTPTSPIRLPKSIAKLQPKDSVQPSLVLPHLKPNSSRKIQKQDSFSSSSIERRTPTSTLNMPKSQGGRPTSKAKALSRKWIKSIQEIIEERHRLYDDVVPMVACVSLPSLVSLGHTAFK